MSDEEEVGTAVIRLRVNSGEADEEIRRKNEQYEREGNESAKRRGKKQGEDEGDAYSRALKAKLEATLRELPKKQDLQLNANTDDASRKLFDIREELNALAHSKIGVDLSDQEAADRIKRLTAQLEVLSRDRNIHVRVDAAAAYAQIKVLDKAINGLGDTSLKAGKEAEKEFNLLFTSIIAVAPALVPLAGGLLGASSAAVGLGIAGVAAIKGISDEVKRGTPLGHEYQEMWKSLSTQLQTTEHIAAKGVFSGLDQAVTKLRHDMPQLNNDIAVNSKILGDVASHTVGGLISGLNTFEPLILKAEEGVDKLATRFETWASGGGGEHFMHTLSDDMELALPALGSLVQLAVNLVSAFHPVGGTVLTEIKVFSDAINAIPLPILQAGATALVAYKTAAIGLAILKPLTTTLIEFGAAESIAAAGSTGLAASGRGLAGSLGAGLARLTPYVGVVIGAEIGLSTAAKATKDWATSQDELTAKTGQFFTVANKFAHLDISGGLDFIRHSKDIQAAVKDAQADIDSVSQTAITAHYAPEQATYQRDEAVFEGYRATFNRLRDAQSAAQKAAEQAGFRDAALNQRAQALADQTYAAKQRLIDQTYKLNQIDQGASGGPAQVAAHEIQANYEAITKAANKYFLTVERSNEKIYANTRAQLDASGAISKASGAYDTLEQGLQKSIDSEKTWTEYKKNESVNIDGTRYSLDAWNKAMDQANGNILVAKGLLKGHADALINDQAILARLQRQQDNINTAYSDASTQLNLTTDQLDLYSSALGITTTDLADGVLTSKQFTHVMGEVKTSLLNADTATAKWLSSVSQFNKSGKTAADVATLMGAALEAGRGVALDYAGANLSAASGVESAADAMGKYSKSIDQNGNLLGQLVKTSTGWKILQPDLTAGSIAIAQALQQQADSAKAAAEQVYQNEVNTKGTKVATQDFLDVYKGYRDQLITTAETTNHISAPAAQKLVDKYLAIPKNVQTAIKQIGAGTVQGAIADLTTAISHLDTDIRLYLGLDDTNFNAKLTDDERRLITLTTNYGTLNAHLKKDGGVMDFYANGAVLNNLAKVEHFANGSENHIAEIAPAGAMRVWAEPETGGESYIPLAPEKRGRSLEIWAETGKRLGVGMKADGESGNGRGAVVTAAARNPQIDELISALERFLADPRPVVLEASGTQLAQVVADQNLRRARRG